MDKIVLVIRANQISSLLLAEQLNRLGYQSWSCSVDQSNLIQTLIITSPEFAIVDIDANCVQSTGIIQTIRRQSPMTKCIAFVVGRNCSLSILHEDASGYLSNQATLDELRLCLSELSNGQRYISDELKQYMNTIGTNNNNINQSIILDKLTKREKEIMLLISKGYTNQKIANLIYRSPKTVAAIKYNLVKKLDLRTAKDLVSYAITIYGVR